MRLEHVNSKVYVSMDVLRVLWGNIAHIITHTLVQGYKSYIFNDKKDTFNEILVFPKQKNVRTEVEPSCS